MSYRVSNGSWAVLGKATLNGFINGFSVDSCLEEIMSMGRRL